MREGFMAVFLLAVVEAVACEESAIQALTGVAGQNITLHTGVTRLHNNSQGTWVKKVEQQEHLLISFDSRKMKWIESPRFTMDEMTGSLSIQSLSSNDSGLYRGVIFSTRRSECEFALTVVEPLQITERNHWAAFASFGLYVLTCFVLMGCGLTQRSADRQAVSTPKIGPSSTLWGLSGCQDIL